MRDGNLFLLVRELDRRTGDGLDVRLLWNEYDGRVAVFVHDPRTGDGFCVPVLPHDQAVEVFDHPFAYAAARGIPTNDVELELLVDAPLAAWPVPRWPRHRGSERVGVAWATRTTSPSCLRTTTRSCARASGCC